MKLPAEEARRLCENALTTSGLHTESAQIVADVLIEAELRGRKGHGLIRLPALAKHARKPCGEVTVIADGVNWVHLDAGGRIGYLAAHRAMTLAIAKARESGTGLAAVRNTTHCGMLGYYVLMAANEGLIGFMTCNCSARVAPYGGASPVFGTNPIAVAIPGPDEPILVDMATSAATTGDLLVALRSGEPLDRGLAYDSDGNPTRDPEVARAGALAAFGGHKGSALALVTQIISGILTGASPLPKPGRDYGYFVAAVDPGRFTEIDTFRRGVAEVLDAMKTARPIAGEILFPGERSHQCRERTLEAGIEIEGQLMAEIQALL